MTDRRQRRRLLIRQVARDLARHTIGAGDAQRGGGLGAAVDANAERVAAPDVLILDELLRTKAGDDVLHELSARIASW